jgi:D-3-phosphoglycerate dehydrogenase
MTKVLIATEKPFAPAAVNGIREVVEGAGYELVLLESYTDKADLLAAVADVDAIIIRSDNASREVIEAAKNLKVIVRAGAGFDNIDLEACTEKGVVAMNTPGQNSNAVAELVLGMMVFLARNTYSGKAGTELRGKRRNCKRFWNGSLCFRSFCC